MNERIGLIRVSAVALALAVLGPALAESQIVVVCGVYRDSYPDTEANLCHGRGSGCMECTILMFKGHEGGGPTGPVPGVPAMASHTSGLDYVQESLQPVSLAVNTGFAPTGEKLSACEAPSSYDQARSYDQVRVTSRERVSLAVKDRSRAGLWKQASAR